MIDPNTIHTALWMTLAVCVVALAAITVESAYQTWRK